MEKGKIKQSGGAREVYVAPHDRYVAEFLGGQNVLSGKVDKVNGASLTMHGPQLSGFEVPISGRIALAQGDKVDIAVRRDDIRLLRPEAGAVPRGNPSLSSRVQAIEYQGYFVKVMLDSIGSDDFVAYLTERDFYSDPLKVGDVVIATWQSDHTLLLA